MKVPDIINPFAKEPIRTYPGVLVPLAQAQRHPLVEAEYVHRRSLQREQGSSCCDKAKSSPLPAAAASNIEEDRKSGSRATTSVGKEEGGVLTTDSSQYNPHTIDGLRAEVVEEVGAGEKESAYDCEFLVSLAHVKLIAELWSVVEDLWNF